MTPDEEFEGEPDREPGPWLVKLYLDSGKLIELESSIKPIVAGHADGHGGTVLRELTTEPPLAFVDRRQIAAIQVVDLSRAPRTTSTGRRPGRPARDDRDLAADVLRVLVESGESWGQQRLQTELRCGRANLNRAVDWLASHGQAERTGGGITSTEDGRTAHRLRGVVKPAEPEAPPAATEELQPIVGTPAPPTLPTGPLGPPPATEAAPHWSEVPTPQVP